MDNLLRQCRSCLNLTFSLTGLCFDHNDEIGRQLAALNLNAASLSARKLAALYPNSLLMEHLRRLEVDLKSRYFKARRLQRDEKLCWRHDATRAGIAQLIDAFDQALRLTARSFIRRALEEVKEGQGCRNLFHPRVASNLEDVTAAIYPSPLARFFTGTIYEWVPVESARRVALSQQPIVGYKLAGNDYRLDLGTAYSDSHLTYRVAPMATTGWTLKLHVEDDLQGLGVATRLYREMADRHANVRTWRYMSLKDAGHRFRQSMRIENPTLWPYPNP